MANEFKKVSFKAKFVRSILKGSNLAGISVLPGSQHSYLRSMLPRPGFRPPKTGFRYPSKRLCFGGRGLGSCYQWSGALWAKIDPPSPQRSSNQSQRHLKTKEFCQKLWSWSSYKRLWVICPDPWTKTQRPGGRGGPAGRIPTKYTKHLLKFTDNKR